MNLMLIIPSLCGGGAERVTATLASALCEKHRVVVVTYYTVDKPYAIDERVIIECLQLSGGKNPAAKLKNSMERIKKLKALKRRYRIDCAVSMLYSPNLENVLSKGTEKTIISVRSKYSASYTARLPKLLASLACRKADLTVSLSNNVMDDLVENFNAPPDRTTTIYNPCDIQMILRQKNAAIDNHVFTDVRKKSDFVVITAGRLTDQKGQWHMIKAFAEVIKSHPQASLVILGEGKLEAYLNDLILKLHLENNVFLLGFQANPYAFLGQADIFAFTSLYEGFGNILIEAMACSLAIVSCDCDSGPRELLAPGTDSHQFAKTVEFEEYGVLTPAVKDMKRDAADISLTDEERLFASALIKLMEDRELLNHYRMLSQKRVQDFSVEKIISEWEQQLPV